MNSRSSITPLLAATFWLTITATMTSQATGQLFNGRLAEGRVVRNLVSDAFSRDLDDPFSFWTYFRGEDTFLNVGGWLQTGYHSQNDGLFNRHPDALRMSQAWTYIERSAAPRNGRRIGVGGRFDLMYGTDAQDTQAFGNPAGTWDYLNGWDFGIYGWAVPQLYAEVATENISLMFGHFFTLVGYEVVTAPDNFFYSHAMTMYNSEPFTHTGVLGTISLGDKADIYAGWTLGWDTAFNNLNQGNNFLGGFSWSISDRLTIAYITTIGNFGSRGNGNNGYGHSCVFDVNITERLNYVLQSDLLTINDPDVAIAGEHNIGVNQYLFYTLADRVALGCRFEWWKAGAATGFDYDGQSAAPVDTTSYYEVTAGINFRVNANCRLRPEFRCDWSPGLDYEEFIFGIDWVTVF